MYKLLGFSTQNTLKVLYVLEELKVGYDFKYINLYEGEQKSESFLKENPNGKVPVLVVGEDRLFESGAICRFLANAEHSSLYPENKMARARVDQWMDFFSCHLGRWLSVLFFEHIIKVKLLKKEADKKNCDEATLYATQQFEMVEDHLSKNKYLAGDTLTIADLFAFAYVEQVNLYDFSLDNYPSVLAWFQKITALESIKRAKDVVS